MNKFIFVLVFYLISNISVNLLAFDINIKKDIKYILPNSFIYKTHIDLPEVLSAEDMNLYYKIFNLQHHQDFNTADKIIKKLSNKTLLGYVYYERYESKYYKASISELKNWMKNYYNLPISKDVYYILKKRVSTKYMMGIPKPLLVGPITPIYTQKELINKQDINKIENFNVIKEIVPKKSSLSKKLNKYLKQGKTNLVKELLLKPSIKQALDKQTYAYYSATLSKLYFLDGKNTLSLEWGKKALQNYEKFFPEVSITLGLVSWRQENYKQAAEYFNNVLKNKHLYSSIIISKAGYWAARSYFKLKNFENYYESLRVAASDHHNFYGILASVEIGVSPDYSNNALNISENNIELLLYDDNAKRALALLQFGLVDKAEQELILFAKYSLNKYSDKTQAQLTKALVYLARKVPMPMLSVKLAGMLGIYYGFGYLAYPIFNIGDGSEYIVDPLLIFSIMRRESYFYSRATSKAGAIGLMQLMPSTAKMLIDNISYNNVILNNASISSILKNPKYNFDLGQRYIKMLINSSVSQGNLIYCLAGWNGGLLNVKKWIQDDFRMCLDPLFFIENIPFIESRNFVKKVLTDYWIYQLTIGVTPYTAIKLINSEQPTYIEPSPLYINNINNFSYNLNIDINNMKTENSNNENISNNSKLIDT